VAVAVLVSLVLVSLGAGVLMLCLVLLVFMWLVLVRDVRAAGTRLDRCRVTRVRTHAMRHRLSCATVDTEASGDRMR
jgi:hypothetical protein